MIEFTVGAAIVVVATWRAIPWITAVSNMEWRIALILFRDWFTTLLLCLLLTGLAVDYLEGF